MRQVWLEVIVKAGDAVVLHSGALDAAGTVDPDEMMFHAIAGGAAISGNPRHLANALRKLHAASRSIPMHASPATAHMFIVSPLSGGGIVKLFSTHPPMEERIARLESFQSRA